MSDKVYEADEIVKDKPKLTLRELLRTLNFTGGLEIENECSETLVELNGVDYYVCGLEKILAPQLLDRQVLELGNQYERTLIRVEGVEDAE